MTQSLGGKPDLNPHMLKFKVLTLHLYWSGSETLMHLKINWTAWYNTDLGAQNLGFSRSECELRIYIPNTLSGCYSHCWSDDPMLRSTVLPTLFINMHTQWYNDFSIIPHTCKCYLFFIWMFVSQSLVFVIFVFWESSQVYKEAWEILPWIIICNTFCSLVP